MLSLFHNYDAFVLEKTSVETATKHRNNITNNFIFTENVKLDSFTFIVQI